MFQVPFCLGSSVAHYGKHMERSNLPVGGEGGDERTSRTGREGCDKWSMEATAAGAVSGSAEFPIHDDTAADEAIFVNELR